MVLVARKAMFRLDCLNKLVKRLISGLKYMKVIHVLCEMVVGCCCFCFLAINFCLISFMVLAGYPLFFAMVSIVFHSLCFHFPVMGNVIVLCI